MTASLSFSTKRAHIARAILGGWILLASLAGCATTPAECRRPIGEPGLTPEQASRSPPAAIGRSVTWGGTLVEARNRADATELEVLGFPLNDCGRPRTADAPVGRFIIVRPGYLEVADFKPGQEITASGRIIGVREGRIGDSDYRFAMLEDGRPTVWPPRGGAAGQRTRPWISIGVGAGSGWSGGGVGVVF